MEELKEYLRINKKIEIEKLLPNRKIKRYKTAYYNNGQGEFQFFRPKEKETGSLVDFSVSEIVRFLVYTGDGVFAFKTRVLKCGMKIIKVESPKNYTKIQRRGLLRVDLPLSAELEYNKNNILKRTEIKIINISGSGISFNTNEDLSDCEKIIIAFKMDGKIIEARIRVIEIRKNLRENVEKYRIGAKFVSLNNHEVEHIIKNCIKQQIKTIKRI